MPVIVSHAITGFFLRLFFYLFSPDMRSPNVRHVLTANAFIITFPHPVRIHARSGNMGDLGALVNPLLPLTDKSQ